MFGDRLHERLAPIYRKLQTSSERVEELEATLEDPEFTENARLEGKRIMAIIATMLAECMVKLEEIDSSFAV